MGIDQVWAFLNEKPAVMAAILTFFLTVFWQFFTRIVSPKPKVTWGTTNENVFGVPYTPLPTEEQPNPAPRKNFFYARNLWIWNGGNASAESVEITLNWKPEHIDWYPYFNVEEKFLQNDHYMICVPEINPKTGLSISMLSMNNSLPDVTGIWSKGHNAKKIEFMNQRKFPMWFNILGTLILLLGLAASVYLVILLIQFLFAVYTVTP